MQKLLVFSHLVAIAAFFGASVFLAVAVDVVGRQAGDAIARRHRLAELFRVYNPLSIGALGVVVMTGAWSLTPYKEALRGAYFARVGSLLAGKLALAFLVIMMATWVSFGICHRIVRADQGALPTTDAALRGIVARLRVALWLTIAVTMVTLWVALGLRAPAIGA